MKGHTIVSLGDLMVRPGNLDPSRYPDEVFDLYSIPAFDSGNSEPTSGSQIGSAKQVVQRDDVLLSRIVPHIRRAWVVASARGARQIASGEWIVFRSNAFFPRYLRHLLVSDGFHARFMQTVAGVGGSLLRARPASVARIRISLPPLAEQKRIATILDAAEALREKRFAAGTLVHKLRAATFLDVFGEVDEGRWPEYALGELFSDGPRYGTMVPAGSSGSALCLRVANIQKGQLRLDDKKFVTVVEDRFRLKDGDLVLARAIASRDHLGKCVVVNPGADVWVFDSHLMRLRFDRSRLEPEFVSFALQTPAGRARFLRNTRQSTIQFNVNTKEIAALRIPVPPIDLQRKFVSYVRTFDQTSGKQVASDQLLTKMLQSIARRAFSGKL